MAGTKTARRPERKRRPEKYCTETQYYKGVPVTLIVYEEAHFAALRAKRFMLGSRGGQKWTPETPAPQSGHARKGAET